MADGWVGGCSAPQLTIGVRGGVVCLCGKVFLFYVVPPANFVLRILGWRDSRYRFFPFEDYLVLYVDMDRERLVGDRYGPLSYTTVDSLNTSTDLLPPPKKKKNFKVKATVLMMVR